MDTPGQKIAYWDVNNLYGSVESFPLPVDGFHWLTEQELENFDIASLQDGGKTGYILEVDVSIALFALFCFGS